MSARLYVRKAGDIENPKDVLCKTLGSVTFTPDRSGCHVDRTSDKYSSVLSFLTTGKTGALAKDYFCKDQRKPLPISMSDYSHSIWQFAMSSGIYQHAAWLSAAIQ